MAKDAQQLLADLKTDSALRTKLKAAGPDGFETAAKGAGYNVTRVDFANAIKSHVSQLDLAGPTGFQIADGVVSGVGSGIGSGAVGGVI
jgi:predicted ribosomally synthesized peptide with nif11-like leader